MQKAVFLWTILLVAVSEELIGQNERVIHIDPGKTAGKFNAVFNEYVGAGRANEGLWADWHQQLAYVKKECGFRYIRMHGLFTDDMALWGR